MKAFLWTATLLLLVTTVSAADFAIQLSPELQTIKTNETAEFTLTLVHDFPGEELFTLYSPDVIWDIYTQRPLRAMPGEQFITKLYVRPLNVNPGVYGIPVHVKRTGTNLVRKTQARLELVSPYPPATSYLPAIRGSVIIDRIIDPRKDVLIKVRLQNQNKRDLDRVQIKVRSNVINQDYETSLGPAEDKTVTFAASIDPQTPPQQDVLTVSIIAPEKHKAFQFDLAPVEYFIKSYGGIEEFSDVKKQSLKTTRKITLVNNANTVQEAEYKLKTNWLANIFTRTNPKAKKLGNYLVWDVRLGVGNAYEILVTTNYRPLGILAVLIAIGIVCYFVFRSPLVLKKTARVVSTKEGGISELKVLVELVNRSKKPVKNVRIIDLVPRIAEYVRQSEAGTISPEKVVRHEKKGTIMKWSLDQVLPGEERVISYRIKSKLSILGKVSLPVTIAKFSTEAGKSRTTSSNTASISFLP